jgi:transcriptional regulator GlxA family with amidase domain
MPDQGRLSISNVAVPVADGVAPFELGVACELFALDRSDDGLPAYDFALCSATDAPVMTTAGYTIHAGHRLDRLARADLIVLVAGSWVTSPPDPKLAEQLREAHRRGSHIMAICRGAFVLAATGLLDRRAATTHWRWTEEFAQRFPAVEVRPHSLYVDNGDLSTSGGTSAGIDLGLHLLRRAHGTAVSAAVARRMVTPPHRDGDQAQYIHRPLPPVVDTNPVGRAQQWAMEHLAEPLTVDELARAVHVAPRTFARLFGQSTGTTPARWLADRRIAVARELLETTPATVSHIARAVGFASVDSLQQQFRRVLGTTPSRYRQTFARGAGHDLSDPASGLGM